MSDVIKELAAAVAAASSKKCEQFCNAHCVFDCPNAAIEAFEAKFDIPAIDAGYHRIKCRDCRYTDKHCTCDDCYFKGDDHCPIKSRGC